MQETIVFLVRVQCRRKKSSRSLSHLLMSFLLYNDIGIYQNVQLFIRSKNNILNAAVFKYSLNKVRETILNLH